MIEKIIEIMSTPLPSIEYQKKELYKPTETIILDTHALLNAAVFSNVLPVPPIRIKRMNDYGRCTGHPKTQRRPHHAAISMRPKYHCVQWLVLILAHEMVHQYQWEVDGPKRMEEGKHPLLSHGPTFFEFRPQLKQVGVRLQREYCSDTWIETQTKF